MSETGGTELVPGKSAGVTWKRDCLHGHSAYRQQELYKGLIMELWKPGDDENRSDTSGEPVRSKVEMRRLVADEAVVVMKFL